MVCKVTDEEFEKIVLESFSIAQVIEKSGLVVAGGNYQTTKNRIKRLKLNTNHFTGQGWSKNKKFGNKRPVDDYLDNKFPIGSHALKKRLLKENIFERKCYCCFRELWGNLPIPLELHHIDGNHENNNLSNLMILCPNCHAITDNYRGKNKK